MYFIHPMGTSYRQSLDLCLLPGIHALHVLQRTGSPSGVDGMQDDWMSDYTSSDWIHRLLGFFHPDFFVIINQLDSGFWGVLLPPLRRFRCRCAASANV
jgi:hypothetical protein